MTLGIDEAFMRDPMGQDEFSARLTSPLGNSQGLGAVRCVARPIPDVGGEAKAERVWRAFVYRDYYHHLRFGRGAREDIQEVQVDTRLFQRAAPFYAALHMSLGCGLVCCAWRQGDP